MVRNIPDGVRMLLNYLSALFLMRFNSFSVSTLNVWMCVGMIHENSQAWIDLKLPVGTVTQPFGPSELTLQVRRNAASNPLPQNGWIVTATHTGPS